jgi:hypothetical protein
MTITTPGAARLHVPAQRRPSVPRSGHAAANRPARRPDVSTRLLKLEALRRLSRGVELEVHLVAVEARKAGATWEQIGSVLGLTAKSAWKRYVR